MSEFARGQVCNSVSHWTIPAMVRSHMDVVRDDGDSLARMAGCCWVGPPSQAAVVCFPCVCVCVCVCVFVCMCEDNKTACVCCV